MNATEIEATSFSSVLHETSQAAIDATKSIFVGIHSIITTPPLWAYGLVALFVSVICLLLYLNRRWV